MKYLDNPVVPFGFIVFYLFHPIILPAGGLHQTLAIAILLLYAIVSALRLHRERLCNKFVYYLDVFLLVQLSYFAFRYLGLSFSNPQHHSFAINQIESVLIVMMPIYTFYYYGIKGKLTKKHIIWFSLIFLVLSIPMFYYSAAAMMEKYSWIEEYNDTTNNKAYFFVQCCVFLPLIGKNKILSAVVVAIIIFFLILGVKRGAILCFVCILPFYLKFLLKGIKWYAIIIVTVGFFIMANWMIDYFSNMDYLFTRIEETREGNVSARDRIYGGIIDYYLGPNSNIFTLLFGFGFCAAVDMVGALAHNDWLELLAGFGLMGLLLYVLFVFSVISIYKKTEDKALKLSIGIAIIMWIIQASVSMAYSFSNFQFLLLGGLCGMSLYEKKINLRNSLKKNR